MKNKPQNCAKVWMYFGIEKVPGIYYNNHFYNSICKIVVPDDWSIREKKVCHVQFTQPRSGGVSSANVTPLSSHPKFVRYVQPTTQTLKPTCPTRKEKN